jgi:hypothetical protein
LATDPQTYHYDQTQTLCNPSLTILFSVPQSVPF